ncbi:MAG: KH domain-containing protein [Caldiserica bacterium]|nr:KH domain-containing protein [Caldisericota bacterium]
MKQLVETIVKALVDSPEEVVINEIAGEQSVTYEIKVGQKDTGKVIGKMGRTAQAIRTIVRAVSAKTGKSATVQIDSMNDERAEGGLEEER